MTVKYALNFITRELGKTAEALHEAQLLLTHILGVEVGGLPTMRDRELDDDENVDLNEMLARRKKGEPLQYILGEWEFMGLPFIVRPGALIPRQDTETLVELALKLANERNYTTALDLCCGTGCIGIALAKLCSIKVTAADISAECVRLTKENAKKNKVMITVLEGSYFDPVTGRFDIIVCNPPYIESNVIGGLQTEIAYEPRLALDGGADGLNAYRAIRKDYECFLNPGGAIIMEIGAGQAEAVKALFGQDTCIYRDLNGLDRVACVVR